MKVINKIKLYNFKRFTELEVDFDNSLNLLIGDNEAGKSTILLALDAVLSGNRNKIETIGLDNIINHQAVTEFLTSDKKIENLPSVFVEVYLNEQDNHSMNGKINSDGIICDGLTFSCEPIDELSSEINEILGQDEPNFPYEYYSIKFNTFSGEAYTGYRRFLKHLVIDSSQISNEHATRAYIKTIYNSKVIDSEKNKHQNEYRRFKDAFTSEVLEGINDRLEKYKFTVTTSTKSNLETDLTISEDGIVLDNKGKGSQCFIKTEFALQRNDNEKNLDILLLEEPENHLSHINMKKLIRRISSSENKQLFITTHNNLISTRLDLRKSILLNSNNPNAVLLKDLPEDTSKFFIKAPDNNILEFILSKKVILVEGDAEYILLDKIYTSVTGEKIEDSDIHIISVGGTSFKRYLDIALLLGIKTVVIRDNDGDYANNCVDNYSDYDCDFIKIFSDEDNDRYTFEVCLYQDNIEICDTLFGVGRRTLSVQEYMLKNKANCAYELLAQDASDVVSPNYIKEAIEWIKE